MSGQVDRWRKELLHEQEKVAKAQKRIVLLQRKIANAERKGR